jgi:translation initiation factor IF-2
VSETDNDKPKLGMRAPLGVRRTVETGKVKQSFSHGRSNTVIVETKKARTFRKPGDPAPTEQVAAPAPAEVEAPSAPAPRAEPPAPPRAPSNETPQERQARLLREAEEQRMRALEEQRHHEEAERARAAEAQSALKETEQAKAGYRAETTRLLSDRHAQAASRHAQLNAERSKAQQRERHRQTVVVMRVQQRRRWCAGRWRVWRTCPQPMSAVWA